MPGTTPSQDSKLKSEYIFSLHLFSRERLKGETHSSLTKLSMSRRHSRPNGGVDKAMINLVGVLINMRTWVTPRCTWSVHRSPVIIHNSIRVGLTLQTSGIDIPALGWRCRSGDRCRGKDMWGGMEWEEWLNCVPACQWYNSMDVSRPGRISVVSKN
jgi:hypothetical protein